MNTFGKTHATDITAKNTRLLKGIAVILLMWLHLFGVDFSGDWISPLKGVDIMSAISASICRAVFLFCSGYGLYRSYISKKAVSKSYVLKKAAGTFIPYWIVMIISIVCLAILGKFDPQYLPGNIFCWILDDNLYVSFAWYIKLYLLIIIVLPLIRLIEQKWKKNLCLDLLLYIVLPFVIYYAFRNHMDEANFKNVIHSIVSSLLLLMYWFPLFGVGLVFSKYEFYNHIKKISEKIPKWLLLTILFLTCGYVLFLRYRFRFDNITDVVYMPLFIISILLIVEITKFRSKYVMPFLGDKSLLYWLLSSMFFLNTVELQPLVYWPRIPILILIWTVILLTPFVYCCDWLSNKLLNLIFRNKKADSM